MSLNLDKIAKDFEVSELIQNEFFILIHKKSLLKLKLNKDYNSEELGKSMALIYRNLDKDQSYFDKFN